MSADSPIDEDRLRELENDFGAEDMDMVVEAFLEESTEMVEALAEMVSDAADENRVAQFHCLAGAAQNLGARRFGILCKKLETENGPFLSADYEAFRAEYQVVLDFFANRGAPPLANTA